MGFSSLAVFTEWSPTGKDSKMRLAFRKEGEVRSGEPPFLISSLRMAPGDFLGGAYWFVSCYGFIMGSTSILFWREYRARIDK